MKEYTKLLTQYYNADNIQIKQDLRHKIHSQYGTDKKCFRCGSQLLISDLKQYEYLCLECNENFYSFEIL